MEEKISKMNSYCELNDPVMVELRVNNKLLKAVYQKVKDLPSKEYWDKLFSITL